MLTDYKNGCSQPETFEVYTKLHKVNHVHTLAMHYDEELGEVVEFSFTHGVDLFHGQVLPETGVVTLLMEYEVDVADGKKEPVVGLYGYAELDKLIEFLNKIPHINDVLIDTGGIRERVH
jgi:hypothetical protein